MRYEHGPIKHLIDNLVMINLTISIRIALTLLSFSLNIYAAPDEERMGKASGYPACTPSLIRMECRVGYLSFPHGRRIEPSTTPNLLQREPYPPKITYRWGLFSYTAEEYFESQKATGLLILKNGKIIFEGYQYGRQPANLFLSQSMSKTVTALLIGIAKDKGHIKSLDDVASIYFPEVAGTAYGETTIRNLLRMSSGVRFQETYSWSPDSDLMRFIQLISNGGNQSMVNASAHFNVRDFDQGTRFNYAGSETEILARVLSRATGKNLTELTRDWLWEPMGAEFPSYWRYPMMGDGIETAAGGFYASLRDWGRLGNLLANDGRQNTKQLISQEYLLDATDVANQPSNFKPRVATNYFGYGFQTWLFPMKKRTFAFQGIYGQSIYVQPESGVVMVQTSAYDNPSGDPMNRAKLEFWKAVLNQLGGDSAE